LLTDPEANSDIPYWSTAAAYNGKLYFVSRDFDDGLDRLWVSNGTRAGTKQLGWSPAADEMYIVPLTGQNLYFSTVIAGTGADPAFFLWSTDGTAGGTRQLTSAGELEGASSEAAYMGGRLYINAGALWKTNGTVRGTKEILDQSPYFLTAAGGRLFFAAGVPNDGWYLWTSDGTATGTDFLVAFGVRLPRQLVAFGESVFFKIENFDANWWQLWASDGTRGGTWEAASFVNPNATLGDGPLGVTIGDTLLFAADDGDRGLELWSYSR
jgi:hypothetical protein